MLSIVTNVENAKCIERIDASIIFSCIGCHPSFSRASQMSNSFVSVHQYLDEDLHELAAACVSLAVFGTKLTRLVAQGSIVITSPSFACCIGRGHPRVVSTKFHADSHTPASPCLYPHLSSNVRPSSDVSCFSRPFN